METLPPPDEDEVELLPDDDDDVELLPDEDVVSAPGFGCVGSASRGRTRV